ncbi:MAG: transcriptional regulator, partial [Gammaproteobacteria bacterium]|nr:transcriptional regulator [Gammaproteobacteria bacterium]
MRYSFSNIEIDTERFELRRDGELCSAEPKVFDLLVILVRHPGQVLNRDMLVEKVWGGRPVAETTISTCIKHARRLLGDTGNTQRFIKTLRGRGYCFDADVRVDDNLLTEPPAPAAARRGDAAATPALLVMPLRAVSETGMATQLAQTLAAGLTTLLGRIPLLRLAVHPGTGNEKTATPSAR